MYIPIIQRLLTILTQAGLLFVGDCKLSALATRACLHWRGHHYLAPLALTPPHGRGKRPIKDKVQLRQAAQGILQAQHVEGLLAYTFERQEERLVQFVGRGRGAANRPQRIVEQVRYQITSVVRHEADITALKGTFGWRAYATDVPAEQLKKPS